MLMAVVSRNLMRAFNHNARWTPEQVAIMTAMFVAKEELKTMCVVLGRTAGAICGKLHDIKFLRFDASLFTYTYPRTEVTYASSHDVRVIDAYMKDIDPSAPWSEWFTLPKVRK